MALECKWILERSLESPFRQLLEINYAFVLNSAVLAVDINKDNLRRFLYG